MIPCFGSKVEKMNLFVRFSLFSFLVFIMQMEFGVGKVAFPWENTQLAENFMESFLRIITRNPAFTPSQLDELISIRKTMTTAMEKFSSSNTSSKIKFQALNMLFASAIAEIIVSEGSVNIVSKIDAIERALNSAYVETIGEINSQYVNDIISLIYTLTHTPANGVSTTTFTKVGDNRQGSLEQQETSPSDKITTINDSTPQRKPISDQELPNLESSLALNIPSGYVSTLPFMARLQRPSLQTPSEHQTKGSLVTLNTKRNSQGVPNSEVQESSPPGITSVQDQKELDGYGAKLAVSSDTDGSLASSGPLSSRFEVNGLVQQGSGDYEYMREDQINQKKSRTIDQESGSDGSIASRNYGVGKIAVGMLGISELEGKGPEIQQPSTAGGQESSIKKTAASFIIDKESSRDVKGLIEQGSLESREYQQNDLQSFVALNQRSKDYEPYYELDAATSVSDRVRSFKSPPNTGELQESQGPTRKDTKGSNGYGPRVVATIASDSYGSGTGSRRFMPEEQDVQGLFRKESQYEREPSRQIFNIREPYETGYQEGKNRLEDQTSYINLSGTTGGGASKFEQGLSNRKTSKVGNSTSNSGLNNKEIRTSATVSTTAIGYKPTNDTKGLHGLVSSEPKSEGNRSFASGFAAAVSGFDTARPIRVSRISNSDDNSESSTVASSLVTGIPIKSAAVANSPEPQIEIANPSLSNCNALIQTLLDIISDLVRLIQSCKIGQVQDVASTQYASTNGQSATKPIS